MSSLRAIAYADDISDGVRMAGHLDDGAQAITAVEKLMKAGVHSNEGVALVKQLATASRHGDLANGATDLSPKKLYQAECDYLT